ncbi:hypothetical protein ASPBRDRAFT_523436 [Aspergillus brasiliensis CBS 101740]|uniref:Secreted protein n=1 Tax=Aspergillus brasiliensis (strain CBS 101740 / IMI 381727 / IBT 21946) TaxID=767769 RepID=A0A1L9UQE4_ASPBC|nr:hypothetical protein ASPBRDRAFT_523436 [Aspergillus brasiliensis CBS 101740]
MALGLLGLLQQVPSRVCVLFCWVLDPVFVGWSFDTNELPGSILETNARSFTTCIVLNDVISLSDREARPNDALTCLLVMKDDCPIDAPL